MDLLGAFTMAGLAWVVGGLFTMLPWPGELLAPVLALIVACILLALPGVAYHHLRAAEGRATDAEQAPRLE